MSLDTVYIHLHAAAPPKPGVGAPCNGCGVCCSYTPCPLSRFLLHHRSGTCPALEWLVTEKRYACGLVRDPGRHLPWLPLRLRGLAGRLAARWISAGSGCDCDAAM